MSVMHLRHFHSEANEARRAADSARSWAEGMESAIASGRATRRQVAEVPQLLAEARYYEALAYYLSDSIPETEGERELYHRGKEIHKNGRPL